MSSSSDDQKAREAQEASPAVPAEFYRTLVELAPMPIWIQDGDSRRILAVNDAMAATYGFTRDELLGMTEDELRAGDRAVDGTGELRHRHRDGTLLEVRARSHDAVLEGRPVRAIIVEDQSPLLQAERALRESESWLRSIADSTGDWLWAIDTEGTITYSSRASQSLLGIPADEIVGTSQFLYMAEYDRPEQSRLVTSYAQRRTGWSNVLQRFIARDGSEKWVESSAVPVIEADGRLSGFRGVDRDITERAILEKRLRHQAYHDPLTDLPNRLLFLERLERVLAFAKGHRIAVFFLDVDNFKVINDSLGHKAGDELLRELARRLTASLPEPENVARAGGDEFVFFAHNIGPIEATRLAEDLLRRLAQPLVVGQHSLYVSGSIGVSIHPQDGLEAEDLIRHADNAMYRAKELGRNTVQLFTPAMGERYRSRLAMELSLRTALEEKQFVLHYQPLIHGDEGHMVGVEALIRWNHPERGFLAPEEFIPLAEETRMIIPIGEWVLRQACSDLQRWNAAGFGGLRVAVNLSASQLQHGDLIPLVKQVIGETGIDPSCLEFEITESVAMQNAELTLTTLNALKEMGVGIAVDDFGTGYSSLVYLTRFPINTVKVDRTFVQNLSTDQNGAAVVAAVVALAHSLKLRTVAEGVETEEQLQFLRLHHCSEVQGFLYSAAITYQAILDMLRFAESKN